MKYDKPYRDIENLVKYLKDEHKLKISDEKMAKRVLAFTPYYDLVNGYKECFMDENDHFLQDVTFESLDLFHVFNRGFENRLFECSIIIESYFKNSLAQVISEDIGIAQEDYLNPANYVKGRGKVTRGKVLSALRWTHDKSYDNPTAYYREHHNHIPPWILLKNVSFSNSINLFSLLERESRKKLLDKMIAIPFSDDQRYQLLLYILTLTRKLRNVMAHNLKFVSFSAAKYGQNLSKSAIRALVPQQLLLDSEVEDGYGALGIYGYIYFTLSIMPDSFMKLRLCYNISSYFDLFAQMPDLNNYWKELGEDYLRRLSLPTDLQARLIHESVEIVNRVLKQTEENVLE